jgi:hypothetical protein
MHQMPRLAKMLTSMVNRPLSAFRSPDTEALMLSVAETEAKAVIGPTNGLMAAESAVISPWSIVLTVGLRSACTWCVALG